MVSSLTIHNTKPGTLDIDVDATLKALQTQYQFCADAIIARHSADAPTLEQLGMIRDAHLNLFRILTEYKATMQREERLRKILIQADSILGVSTDFFDDDDWRVLNDASRLLDELRGNQNEVSDAG